MSLTPNQRAMIRCNAACYRRQYVVGMGCEYVTTVARYREMVRQYGLPNALPLIDGRLFGKWVACLFVDDHNDGKPMAFVPVWVLTAHHRAVQRHHPQPPTN